MLVFDRNELEAFVVLAEELHFGRAAERIHVSTPQLSQVIRRLERRVGSALFRRTTRKVELTAVGRQVYLDIGPAWAEFNAVLENALRVSRSLAGVLHLAFITAGGSRLLVEAGRRFAARHPGCRVSLREASLDQVGPWLQDGVVDAVLLPTGGEQADLAVGEVLARTPLVLAVPSTHGLARVGSVSGEDLARVPMITLPDSLPAGVAGVLAPCVTAGGKPISPGPLARTWLEAFALAASGQGGLLVDATAVQHYPSPDLSFLPVRDLPPLTWRLAWRADHDKQLIHNFTSSAIHISASQPQNRPTNDLRSELNSAVA